RASSRTGYHPNNLLRPDAHLGPTSTNPPVHYSPRIRWTDLYLAYAESANEAWGPMASRSFGSHNFSAYDVISALRERQGITPQPDSYLQSIGSAQEAMRNLIRDVRRIELAFEAFRFWDLRRWNMDLTETADGVSIENGNHNIINVESRDRSEGHTSELQSRIDLVCR